VLVFPPAVSNGAAAVAVFGQPDFSSGSAPNTVNAQTLSFPSGISVDAFGFLYAADSGANRVLLFPNAEQASGGGESASMVLGQPGFSSAGAGAGANRLRNPQDVETDAAGNIYVSDGDNHRIVRFPSLLFLPLTNGEATQAVGQSSINGTRANFNSSDGFATAEGLFAPSRIQVDRNATLYVADTGNSRVVHFLRPATATSRTLSVDDGWFGELASILRQAGGAEVAHGAAIDQSAAALTARYPV
jgi:sugar lactone lactonase YvrE